MAGLDFLFIYAETGLSPLMYSAFLPPLGSIQIAIFLRERGYKARVIDTRRRDFTPEWLASYVHDAKPKFIGFSLQTDTMFNVRRLIDLVRRESPGSKIVCGGPHATICDKSVLNFADVDFVVRGGGEAPALALLENKDPSDIGGIAYRRGKRLIRAPESKSLPIDHMSFPDCNIVEGIDEIPYTPSIVTGYGCPYRCTFCAAALLHKKVYLRPTDDVVQEILEIRRRFSNRLIMILDDTFTIDVPRIKDFCEKAMAAGGGRDFFWYAEGRVDVIAKNPDILKIMYDAGLRMLQFGVESADERVLAAYRKQIKLGDVEKLCVSCADLGIFTHTNFIVGGPFETEKTVAKTRAYAKKLIELCRGFMQMGFMYLTPLPGTDIFMRPGDYDIKMLDPDLVTSASFDNCVTETRDLSRDDIIFHRVNLLRDISNFMIDAYKSQPDGFREYCDSIGEGIGPFHFAMYLHRYRDWNAFYEDFWSEILRRSNAFSSFVHRAADGWRDLVPVRSVLVTGGVPDLQLSFLDHPMSHPERSVFDMCAGKLTGSEISEKLSLKDDDMESTLLSLEKKGIILYRTF